MPHSFRFRRYCLPLRTPLRTAHGWWREREGILIRLEDASGRVGFGEVAPIPWFGTETVAEAEEFLGKFGDRLTDDALDQVPEKMGCVRFALAAALRQGSGQALAAVGRGFPLDRLGALSLSKRQIPPATEDHAAHEAGFGDPALQKKGDSDTAGFGLPSAALAKEGNPALQAKPRVPLTALLPAGRDAIGTLTTRLEAGWLSFKWKVGVGEPDAELGLLDELLERLPTYANLRLDANGAWSRRQAARWLERCAERPVEFVEQPVAPADADTLLGLASDYPVKLALDESVVRLEEAREWQARGWPGVFVIKPALAGPLEELADWAARTKPDVVLSSAIETVLGRAAILDFVTERCPELLQRSPGFGVGEIFGDRRWDGPVTGPMLDRDWGRGVNAAEMWAILEGSDK